MDKFTGVSSSCYTSLKKGENVRLTKGFYLGVVVVLAGSGAGVCI